MAGLASLGRKLALIGEARLTGLGIFDLVEHPGNTRPAIFGLILGAGALLDVAKVGKAALLQRAIGRMTW